MGEKEFKETFNFLKKISELNDKRFFEIKKENEALSDEIKTRFEQIEKKLEELDALLYSCEKEVNKTND